MPSYWGVGSNSDFWPSFHAIGPLCCSRFPSSISVFAATVEPGTSTNFICKSQVSSLPACMTQFIIKPLKHGLGSACFSVINKGLSFPFVMNSRPQPFWLSGRAQGPAQNFQKPQARAYCRLLLNPLSKPEKRSKSTLYVFGGKIAVWISLPGNYHTDNSACNTGSKTLYTSHITISLLDTIMYHYKQCSKHCNH